MALKSLNSDGGFGLYNGNIVIDADGNFSAANLTVSGTSNLGPIANVIITGGSNGQVVITDGNGVLSFTDLNATSNRAAVMPYLIPNGESYIVEENFQGLFFEPITIEGEFEVDGILIDVSGAAANGGGTPGGSNTQVQFNDGNTFAGNAGLTFNKTTTTLRANNFAVTSTTDLGSVSNVVITGGSNGQFLKTNGAGLLSWATVGDATNVLYVSKDGNDSNSGNSLESAKLTIAGACAVATTGTTIFVKSGDYTEVNPVSVPAGVAIVGDNLRTVTVRPATPTSDVFHVRNKCYVTGITFRDHLNPSAAIAFPSAGAGAITTSPYIQNCSSITTTGCGMRIDGSLASGLKSMVLDSYTQFNQGGKGIHITNSGYAQLVSIFTICCSIGVHCESGGQCSVSNSNNSFGDYALWADGKSSQLYAGNVVSFTNGIVVVDNLPQRPSVNDSFQFAGDTTWYTVKTATALVSGESTITFDQPPGTTPTVGDGVSFYQPSFISASGQTFEYVGTGTNILTATPRLGGIPIQANEVIQANGGIVNWTSTDQFGDFRIGAGLTINEEAGIITGTTFEKSLFAIMTPYILALEN
jgi:hypothetical protein